MKYLVALSTMVLFSGSVMATPAHKVNAYHKQKKTVKHRLVKPLLKDDAKKIDSNAYNFKSVVSSSVNPQTGQLNTGVTLGHLSAHQLAADFVLKALYDQNNQANTFGLGQGWSLNFTAYDIQNNELHTSNGSSYKANPASGSCVYPLPTGVIPNVGPCTPQTFQYHKLKDIVLEVYRDNGGNFSGAQVIYTDGHREILDHNGRLIQIIYPRGYAVTITYPSGTIQGIPSNIQDNFGDEISITPGVTTQFTSTFAGKSQVVSVQAGSATTAQLENVTEGDTATGSYETKFQYQSGTNLLQTITYPSGAQDVITYGEGAAAGLPVKVLGGQTQYLPVVIKMKSVPSTANEQPTVLTYSYGKQPNYNYTGFPMFSVSDKEDPLFAEPNQFLYKTTESISLGYNDNDSSVEKITRTYEHHHYLMEQKVELYNTGTGKSIPVKETYYSYCNGVAPGPIGTSGQYPGQSCIMSTPGTLPVTSGLPAAVQTVSYDQAGNKRVDQKLMQYDDSGNLTSSIVCSDADIANGKCFFSQAQSSITDSTKYALPIVPGGITNVVLSKTVHTPFDGTTVTSNAPKGQTQLQIETGLDGLSYQVPG